MEPCGRLPEGRSRNKIFAARVASSSMGSLGTGSESSYSTLHGALERGIVVNARSSVRGSSRSLRLICAYCSVASAGFYNTLS